MSTFASSTSKKRKGETLFGLKEELYSLQKTLTQFHMRLQQYNENFEIVDANKEVDKAKGERTPENNQELNTNNATLKFENDGLEAKITTLESQLSEARLNKAEALRLKSHIQYLELLQKTTKDENEKLKTEIRSLKVPKSPFTPFLFGTRNPEQQQKWHDMSAGLHDPVGGVVWPPK
ncbi:hypothetical protein K461DRAFT_293642 [Myriangium duriaei CBS 260.36]|uniref:Uncharacterized protein n=1 Tax=Myriangium duriaei CBS 260.36 TaxID=1168546 RepID=A0A9P4J1D5_9PEZI|nr:hypothetical protein K461DRAFT_293642 [Myriangium duriaei CBS 260.36]